MPNPAPAPASARPNKSTSTSTGKVAPLLRHCRLKSLRINARHFWLGPGANYRMNRNGYPTHVFCRLARGLTAEPAERVAGNWACCLRMGCLSTPFLVCSLPPTVVLPRTLEGEPHTMQGKGKQNSTVAVRTAQGTPSPPHPIPNVASTWRMVKAWKFSGVVRGGVSTNNHSSAFWRLGGGAFSSTLKHQERTNLTPSALDSRTNKLNILQSPARWRVEGGAIGATPKH